MPIFFGKKRRKQKHILSRYLKQKILSKQNCQVVIVEGILYSDLYRELFKVLKAEFRKIHAYYYDIPFEETSIRHQTKPISNQFGEKEMRDWWRENDYIGIIPEKIITEELEIEEIVEMIYRDVTTDD